MQRDRDFEHYEDLEARYDLRPSALGRAQRRLGSRTASSWCRFPIPTRPTTTSSPTGCPTSRRSRRQPYDFEYRILWQKDAGLAAAVVVGDADAPRPRLRPERRRQHRLRRSTSTVPRCGNCPPTRRSKASVSADDQRAKCVELVAHRNDVTGGWRLTLAHAPAGREQAGRIARLSAQRRHTHCRRRGATFFRPGRRAATPAEACVALSRSPSAHARAARETAGAALCEAMATTLDAAMARCIDALAGGSRRPTRPIPRTPRSTGGSSSRTRSRTSRLCRTLTAAMHSGRERLATAPPLARTSMVPRAWPRGLFARLACAIVGAGSKAARPARAPARGGRARLRLRPIREGHWHRVADFRRLVLLGLIVSQTYIATNFMIAVLPYHGTQPLEIAILVLFAILFGWVSAGFWTAMAGFVLLLLGSDRYAISRTRTPATRRSIQMRESRSSCRSATKTSPRVFAGLRATLRIAGAHRRASSTSISSCSPTPAIPTPASRKSPPGSTLCRAVERLRPRLLSLAPASHQAQERQHRRLLPALGQQLPLHGRARRRQRDERRLPDHAAAPDRSQSRTSASSRPRRAPPDATRSTRASSSSRRASTARCSPPACISGSSANRTTGATTRSSASRRSCATARLRRLPGRGLAVGRDPVARLRRSRADAPRRLGGMDRLRPARQLRGDAAEPDRRAEARPPLVPGQSDELPAVPDEGTARRRTARCS